MNRISIQQLASSLPDGLVGAGEQAKLIFVKSMFEILASELASGHDVIVKGLGKFSVVDDSSDPVSFIPDDVFAGVVNAPFIGFEPEVLAPEVTDDMLSGLDTSDLELENKEVASEPDTVVVETIVEEQSEEPVAEIAEAPETESIAPELIEEPESEIETVVEPEVPVGHVAENVVESPVPQSESAVESALHEPVYRPETAVYPESSVDSAYGEESEEEQVEPRSRFSTGFFCGLLAGLAVGAIAFLLYVIFDINKSTLSEPETDEYVITDDMPDTENVGL